MQCDVLNLTSQNSNSESRMSITVLRIRYSTVQRVVVSIDLIRLLLLLLSPSPQPHSTGKIDSRGGALHHDGIEPVCLEFPKKTRLPKMLHPWQYLYLLLRKTVQNNIQNI